MTAVVLGNTNGLEKEGYTFTGWNTTEDGSGDGYVADDELVIGVDDVILYAQWEVNTFTVTFDSNGGSEVEPQTVPEGETATKPANPTRHS